MTGGVMNIYGGTTISYWPYAANASIYMLYDGTVNFHNVGIYIYNSATYALTENILGGTIRTTGGFYGETNEFTPDFGTLELIGVTDANIYTINGCYLNNVTINKSTMASNNVNSQYKSKTNVLKDEQGSIPLVEGTKSNAINLTDFLDINGNLVIDNGILDANGYDIQIAGNWTNNVGDGTP